MVNDSKKRENGLKIIDQNEKEKRIFFDLLYDINEEFIKSLKKASTVVIRRPVGSSVKNALTSGCTRPKLGGFWSELGAEFIIS